jgi:hypothetical protein
VERQARRPEEEPVSQQPERAPAAGQERSPMPSVFFRAEAEIREQNANGCGRQPDDAGGERKEAKGVVCARGE